MNDAERINRLRSELARLAALPPSQYRDLELQAAFAALAAAERRAEREGAA